MKHIEFHSEILFQAIVVCQFDLLAPWQDERQRHTKAISIYQNELSIKSIWKEKLMKHVKSACSVLGRRIFVRFCPQLQLPGLLMACALIHMWFSRNHSPNIHKPPIPHRPYGHPTSRIRNSPSSCTPLQNIWMKIFRKWKKLPEIFLDFFSFSKCWAFNALKIHL